MSIQVQNLSKTYGKKQVFQNLNLSIISGECFCLIGKNGAGKTTLLNAILDLVKPDSGQVLVNGLSYQEAEQQVRLSMGALVEDNPLIEELTGLQYLNLVGRLYKIPASELKQKIDSMAAYFFEDLQDLKKPVAGYSTGMKKKLGVCAAVLHRPNVLLLDEPFTGLDPVAAQLLVQFINRYREGRTVLISSHDLGYVERVATHIGILQEGQLLFNGSLQEFTEGGSNMIDQAVFSWLKPANSNLESIDWLMN